MNLKVDYEKLLDVGRLIKEKDSELKHVLNDFILIIDGVSNGWHGPDSDEFKEKALEFINAEIEKSKNQEQLGNLITTLANNYKNKDLEFKEAVKKVEAD